MNQQDKQLLLTDLCARLPYGVCISFKKEDVRKLTIDRYGDTVDIRTTVHRNGKPILFPISCLTKEITIAGEMFVPAIRIARLIDGGHNHDCSKVSASSDRIRVYTDKCDDVLDAIIKITDYGLLYCVCVNDPVTSITVRKIDTLLLQWHFDINGLIDKGLAISVYSLDKNPYE